MSLGDVVPSPAVQKQKGHGRNDHAPLLFMLFVRDALGRLLWLLALFRFGAVLGFGALFVCAIAVDK